MKLLPKTILALYLLALLWLVLFKFSFDIPAVLSHHLRSLNLIPFAKLSLKGLGETISNVVVFIPFGVLLGVNLKGTTLRQKLGYIFMLSLIVEITQYILAIGVTDVNDVIANTLGGFLGLKFYDLSARRVDNEKLDRGISIAGTVLLTAVILLRLLVFRVRY